jgi:hypothetical protein
VRSLGIHFGFGLGFTSPPSSSPALEARGFLAGALLDDGSPSAVRLPIEGRGAAFFRVGFLGA